MTLAMFMSVDLGAEATMATPYPHLHLQTLPKSLKAPTFLPLHRRPGPLRCAASDADLSARLAKLGARRSHARAALSKSGELLFGGLCKHLRVGPEAARRRWRAMGEIEKLELVKGFVDVWGVRFQPLSSKSAVELVEEHLGGGDAAFSGPSILFSGIRRILRLSDVGDDRDGV